VQQHPLASLVQGRRLLVGGSTHAGEETALLTVYGRLRVQHPDLLLVLAPRHLERVEAVVRHVHASHYQALRRSQCNTSHTTTLDNSVVLILDTMGELSILYRLCTMAFVGGSLVRVGGHNILEPAVFAKPVCFGPYMQHFPELAAMLCEAGGAVQIHSVEELYVCMARVLEQPDEGYAMGQCAFRALVANRGALERTTQAVTALLGQATIPPPATAALQSTTVRPSYGSRRAWRSVWKRS
jgi:3-deoxy-D-manno-octulosonic-acid transferase